jgi:hypothetical protein
MNSQTLKTSETSRDGTHDLINSTPWLTISILTMTDFWSYNSEPWKRERWRFPRTILRSLLNSPKIGNQKLRSKAASWISKFHFKGRAYKPWSPKSRELSDVILETGSWIMSSCDLLQFPRCSSRRPPRRVESLHTPWDAAWTVMLARASASSSNFKLDKGSLKACEPSGLPIARARISSHAQANWRWACCRKEIVGRSDVWEHLMSQSGA